MPQWLEFLRESVGYATEDWISPALQMLKQDLECKVVCHGLWCVLLTSL